MFYKLQPRRVTFNYVKMTYRSRWQTGGGRHGVGQMEGRAGGWTGGRAGGWTGGRALLALGHHVLHLV